jgi:TolA-binding protein
MSTKEDILEQLVEEYLLHDGYFVQHNIKFRPNEGHADYVKKLDSNHSDIDVVGVHPLRTGDDRVVAVSCKSWQGGFNPAAELDAIAQNKIVAGRERWKPFRELVSPKVQESRTLILEMNEKLVNKSYISARLYYDLSDYKASIIALRNSLNEYPDTKYREELMFLLLKSSYLLAENSVASKLKDRYQAAVDEYYSFISEFPKGKYVDDAKKMYEASMRVLGQDINQNSIQ